MPQFFEESYLLPCSMDAAWRLLTESEFTRQYMYGCDLLTNWEIGSPVLWEGPNGEGGRTVFVKGEVVAIDPGRMVEITMFPPGMPIPDIPENYLHQRYTLEPAGAETRLTIWQGDFDKVANGQARYADSQKGWEMVLAEMKKLAKSI